MLKKPESVARDSVKSAKWDEVTRGRTFRTSDTPTLELLCQWHAVAQQCMDDLDEAGGLIYENKVGDIRSLPQLAVMKQASAEIRALNKQLGINDEAQPEIAEKVDNVISILSKRREGWVTKPTDLYRAG